MLNEIMDVLTSKRMMTVGNLAARFEMTPGEMQGHLNQLDDAGRVRLAQSRCNGACSTCSTCTVSASGEAQEAVPEIDPTAIVISKEIRTQDD